MTDAEELLDILKCNPISSREWQRSVRILCSRIERDPNATPEHKHMARICRAIADRGGEMTNAERADFDDFLHGPRF